MLNFIAEPEIGAVYEEILGQRLNNCANNKPSFLWRCSSAHIPRECGCQGGGGGGGVRRGRYPEEQLQWEGQSQQTEDIGQMMGQRWASVVDGGLSLVYAWDNISCLPGWDAELRDTGQQVAVGRAAP